jgi:hypothetical protein
MATQFTPGPWCVTDRDDLFRIREEASDAVLATTDDGGHPTEAIFDYDEQRANAHLIAAAPDLYAALEALVKEANGFESWQRPYAALEPAFAALAKARAKQVSA